MAAAALLGALPALHAQTPLHIRGSIVQMGYAPDGGDTPVIVKLHDGSEVTFQIAFNYDCVELGAVAHDRLMPGTHVGAIGVTLADGTLRALGIVVHSKGYEGSGDGPVAWDAAPQSSFTRATIGSMAAQNGSRTLTLRYPGGEKTLVVADDVPVVAMLSHYAHVQLTPGTHVFVNATRQRDGSILAGRIYYGKDGLTPPM